MKILIAGGTGQLGQILEREYRRRGHEVTILTRRPKPQSNQVFWDGCTLGVWAENLEETNCVINLSGRSVDCRYTDKNMKAMLDSRVQSTSVLGKAIRQAQKPPKVWLQMSTATIYSHRFDSPNDEMTGEIGGEEPGAPDYWKWSVKIAQSWEAAQESTNTPHTRKVAMRTAMVMSPDYGGVFSVLSRLTKLGLGGPIGGGRQFVSWIHEYDFIAAVDFLMNHKSINGPVNLSSPNPIPQKEFMKGLQNELGTPIALPATKWMAELGAFVLRTDTELLLKSRRVIPTKLLAEGFNFKYPNWPSAARELVSRSIKGGQYA